MNRLLLLFISAVLGTSLLKAPAQKAEPDQASKPPPKTAAPIKGIHQPKDLLALSMKKEVKGELKFNPTQSAKMANLEAKAKTLSAEFIQEIRQNPKKRAQAWKNLQQKRKKLEAEMLAFLDEKQTTRLNQIHIQSLGHQVLFQDPVKSSLKITPDQTKELKAIMEAENRDLDALRADNAVFYYIRKRDARKRRDKTQLEVNAVLTAKQRKQLEIICGKPFEFPEKAGF